MPRFGLEDFVCFLEGLPLSFCGLGFVLAGKGGKSCSHGDSGRSRLWVVRVFIIAVFGAIGLTQVSLVICVGSCDRLWEKVCADENDSIGHYVTIVRTCKLELASLTLLFTTILTLCGKVNYAFHAQ